LFSFRIISQLFFTRAFLHSCKTIERITEKHMQTNHGAPAPAPALIHPNYLLNDVGCI